MFCADCGGGLIVGKGKYSNKRLAAKKKAAEWVRKAIKPWWLLGERKRQRWIWFSMRMKLDASLFHLPHASMPRPKGPPT